jgi:hypothetical protein
MAIGIDWASASVENGRLTVALTGKAGKEWAQDFERVIERLQHGGTPWGSIDLGRRKLHVEEIQPGAESELRHFLESVLLEANGGETVQDDEPEGADGVMTATFRAFARG